MTLLALELNGEPLALDHGYPCRLIAPARPGVCQTKWLRRLEVGVWLGAGVLGQFAATAAKPTLLNRDDASGWVTFAAVVGVVSFAVAARCRLPRPRVSARGRAAREDL